MRAALTLALAIALAGCAADEPATPETQAPAEEEAPCPSGKCDGLADTLQDYYDDMRGVDLNDLAGLGVGFATDGVNDLLGATPFVDISLGETAFFGDPDEIFDQVTVRDLKQLHAGLTEALGESAFATRINALRAQTLEGTDATVFAESSFKIKASHNLTWSMIAEELVGSVGFNVGGDVEAILIAPYADNLEAVWRSPLELLKDARGFILPRGVSDLRQMAPGESLALRGEGGLGFNLGVGVPIILGTFVDYVTLRARISAGARVSLKGNLDVQVVRGEGDALFVDVGLSKARLKHFSLGVKSGWGIEALPDVDLELGPISVDLDDIVEKTLSEQLNEKLSVFEGSASYGAEEGRLTVARFRFDLSRDDEVTKQAIAQAMRADLRLAQALANRGDAGVVQELDLSKDYRSESTYFGFRFLSMRFFSNQNFNTGSVHIEADGRHQSLLFSELEESGGLFFNEHSSEWYTLTSLITEEGDLVSAANNVRLTIREGDDYFTQDQLLDHVDSVLVWMIGEEETLNLSALTDEIYTWVDDFCPAPRHSNDEDEEEEEEARYRECVAHMFEQEAYLTMKEEARALYGDLAADLAFGDFDEAFTPAVEVARALFELKLGFSSVHHDYGFLQGPTGSVLSQVRFSQEALDTLFAEGGEARFTDALEAVYWQHITDRDEDLDDKLKEVQRDVSREAEDIESLQRAFNAFSAGYQQLDRVAALRFTGEAPLGEHAQLLLIPVKDPASATLSAVAQRKGELLERFYPDMVERAEKLRGGVEESFIIAYALLNMVKPEQVELLLSYQFDEDADEPYQALKTRIYTRGEAEFISAGDFKLSQLLGF